MLLAAALNSDWVTHDILPFASARRLRGFSRIWLRLLTLGHLLVDFLWTACSRPASVYMLSGGPLVFNRSLSLM